MALLARGASTRTIGTGSVTTRRLLGCDARAVRRILACGWGLSPNYGTQKVHQEAQKEKFQEIFDLHTS